MMSQPDVKTLSANDLRETVCVIVGTRPGIVKQSPLIRALARREMPYFIIHTGQHYSPQMDSAFFADLELPQPAFRLEDVQAHQLHGAQTAAMLMGVERILLEERPRLVLVGGDANTNLAAALAARKLHIPVGHVEAGLRSFDWRMPEEHNRVMIDHISELLFAPGENAARNLARENVSGAIHIVGNTVVDAVRQHLDVALRRSIVTETLRLQDTGYAVLTLHREENVDTRANLDSILKAVSRFTYETGLNVVFPMHPRTEKRVRQFSLELALEGGGLQPIPPVGYLDFLRLLHGSRLLMTDSGGAQQEACILNVPCVTLRDTTEWVETVDIGANKVVGTDPDSICRGAREMLDLERMWRNPFGDGTSGEQVVEICCRFMNEPVRSLLAAETR